MNTSDPLTRARSSVGVKIFLTLRLIIPEILSANPNSSFTSHQTVGLYVLLFPLGKDLFLIEIRSLSDPSPYVRIVSLQQF